ncbi:MULTISPECIES: aspartate aminotransferase family protein [unclassified Crossiella]|uniref:aspartate aminotransferase family protein n=1 Tax=unclassified Crossiella TaxID=2620835 RepID=UPI001FFE50F2|nr:MULTISPECIES: aspartate aminotransferase family protein [unclassified Crossiella]MCK2244373.1 aspartate aminotransferase family protein [Crossiella sp. S99.2]MCK2257799.1 aspartate aminotransferase family protein [Crossiella sp. S99.1]
MSLSPVNRQSNADALAKIRTVIAGGVSSGMRIDAIPAPLVVRRAQGCRVWDVEDNEIIDLNMGYGSHLFGYADTEVLAEVGEQFALGHLTGLPHELDTEAGALIAELVPGIEQVRFANSGTEAVTSALRLARVSTGRSLVVTFEGHYHGWSETVLRAGKAVGHLREGSPEQVRPGAPGMIPEALAHTAQLPWNDHQAVRDLFARAGREIAAVVLEPVLVNANVIPPAPGFLELLRELTTGTGALLVFDEVITGFRVASGGAQQRYGVEPDLTVLSKVLGGGFPVSAFGGRRAAMRLLAANQAHHAGVFAGNHAAIRAVVAQLGKIRRTPGVYAELEHLGGYAEEGVRALAEAEGRRVRVARVGSLVSVALLRQPVPPAAGLRELAAAIDFAAHRRWQIAAQKEGVYFHPNPMEPWFLSTAHTKDVLDKVLATLGRALAGAR